MRPLPRSSLWRQLCWLVALWTASVASLGCVSALLRWWLHP